MRVIYDTDDSVKTHAYPMLIIFLPVFGMIFYLSFGMNFRKRDLFRTKTAREEQELAKHWDAWSEHQKREIFAQKEEFSACTPLIKYLIHDGYNPLSTANDVELLINGEALQLADLYFPQNLIRTRSISCAGISVYLSTKGWRGFSLRFRRLQVPVKP